MTNRKIILLFSFISGFSVMVVELTAARVVAPMLGSSVYTWTSVIGIVLLGTSFGNYTGGKIVDKKNSPYTGGVFFGLASIAILFIPIIANFAKNIALIQIPLWASVIFVSASLFLIPSFFLGSIYPALLKLYLRNISSAGKEAGSISAIMALGSIVGTFLTGFVFIGYIGSVKTLIIISIILFFCSFWLFPKNKLSLLYASFYLITFFLFLFIQNRIAQDSSVIFSKESNYFSIRVVDKYFFLSEKVRLLFLDTDSHSIETDNKILDDIYTNFYPTFSIFSDNNKIDNIAVLGGGSLSISEKFKKYYPEANVTTAEIDPLITEIAEKYFHTSTEITKNTLPIDGRLFLSRSDKKFDIIFSDVFNSFISIPWHLATKEFFQIAKNRLTPNGAFAINFISAQTGESSALLQSMLATFSSVFNNYYVFTYGDNPSEIQNIILVGINSEDHLSDDVVREKLSSLPNGNLIKKHLNNTVKKEVGGIIITDDFAPTDRLMLPAINRYFPEYITKINPFLQTRF